MKATYIINFNFTICGIPFTVPIFARYEVLNSKIG